VKVRIVTVSRATEQATALAVGLAPPCQRAPSRSVRSSSQSINSSAKARS
jgi:hypothetical protein